MINKNSNNDNRHDIRVALFEPRIPQNTGNIGRTCVGFDLTLDLIAPFGFDINDKQLKRAGLDYWQYLTYRVHNNYNCFKNTVNNSRLLGFSKNGNINLDDVCFKRNDILLFGREDSGLPDKIRNECSLIVEIPMLKKLDKYDSEGIRSLNLSVACGIASYIALSNLEVFSD